MYKYLLVKFLILKCLLNIENKGRDIIRLFSYNIGIFFKNWFLWIIV